MICSHIRLASLFSVLKKGAHQPLNPHLAPLSACLFRHGTSFNGYQISNLQDCFGAFFVFLGFYCASMAEHSRWLISVIKSIYLDFGFVCSSLQCETPLGAKHNIFIRRHLCSALTLRLSEQGGWRRRRGVTLTSELVFDILSLF